VTGTTVSIRFFAGIELSLPRTYGGIWLFSNFLLLVKRVLSKNIIEANHAAGGPANFDLSHANSYCSTPQGTGTPVVCSYPQEVGLYLGALSVGLGFPTADVSPGFVAKVLEEYPLPHFSDPFLPRDAPSADEALSRIFTDVVFACNGADSNRDLSHFVPVFGYEFNDPSAPPLGSVPIRAPNDVFGFPNASEHSAELQFLFNFSAPLKMERARLRQRGVAAARLEHGGRQQPPVGKLWAVSIVTALLTACRCFSLCRVR